MQISFDNMKTISDMLVSWLGVLSVIIGGVWSVNKYLENTEKQRVDETLKYVHQFNTGETHKAQRSNTLFWKEVSGELKQINEEEVLAERVLSIILNKDNNSAEQDIWLIVDFYESLSTCMKEKLCDKESAFAFFGDRATRFYNQHFHYISYVRDRQGMNDATYAVAFYDFAAEYYASLNAESE